MNDRAIQVILNYLEKDSEPPQLWMGKRDFEELSFSRWAADELLNAIWDKPLVPAEDTVEAFAIKMELYAMFAERQSASRIFSIAARTAEELLEVITEESK